MPHYIFNNTALREKQLVVVDELAWLYLKMTVVRACYLFVPNIYRDSLSLLFTSHNFSFALEHATNFIRLLTKSSSSHVSVKSRTTLSNSLPLIVCMFSKNILLSSLSLLLLITFLINCFISIVCVALIS